MKHRYIYHRLGALSLLMLTMLFLGGLAPAVLAQQEDETPSGDSSPEATEEAAGPLTDTQTITEETTVTTPLAPVETAVATATPLPEPPESPTAAEAAPAVDREALLRQIALETFTAARPETSADIGLTKIVEPWALLNVRVEPGGADSDTPDREVILGLALWDETTWQVAFEDTPEFSTWLEQIPEALLPAEARALLQPAVSTAAGAPDLALPFPVGRTWKFIHGPNGGTGRDGVDFGPFGLYESNNFDPPGSRARDVTAAADGIVIDRDQNLLILRHANGWESGYFALAAASNGHPLGTYLHRGERVGLASDEVDQEAGVHVHFWIRRWGVTQNIEGFKLSGWQIFNDNSYQAGSRFGTMISDHKTERIDCPTVEQYWLDPQLCHLTHLPPTKSKILLYPKTLYLKPGLIGVTTLDLLHAYDVVSVTLQLRYNQDVVEVVDANPISPGIQIQPGSIFADSGSAIVTENNVDQTAGEIEFAATLTDDLSFSGSGSLVEIAWQGKQAGTTAVTVGEIKVYDVDGFLLSAAVKGGKIIVLELPHIQMQGQATLQGHTDHSGVMVTSGQGQVQTDSQGRFQIETDPAVTITLTAPGHLTAQARADGAQLAETEEPMLDLGAVTLLGGDVTGDDHIDIFDLALIGSRYGSDDPLSDLNGDGVVDIFDLSMSAANYNKQGPIMEWH